MPAVPFRNGGSRNEDDEQQQQDEERDASEEEEERADEDHVILVESEHGMLVAGEEDDDDDIDSFGEGEEEEESPPVLRLHCSSCDARLSSRGMQVFLVADVQTSLYSTDIPSSHVREGERKPIPTCECLARCLHCVRCDRAVGYHVRRPCEGCAEAEHNGHFWLFEASGVHATPREGDLRWDALPYNGADEDSGDGNDDDGGDDSGDEGSGGNLNRDTTARGRRVEVDVAARAERRKTRASEEEDDDANDETCLVCAACPMWRPTRVGGCGHVFCFGCISREVDMRGRCPLDRLPATREALAPVTPRRRSRE